MQVAGKVDHIEVEGALSEGRATADPRTGQDSLEPRCSSSAVAFVRKTNRASVNSRPELRPEAAAIENLEFEQRSMHGGVTATDYFRPYVHSYQSGPYQPMFHHPHLTTAAAAAAAAQYGNYTSGSAFTTTSSSGYGSTYSAGSSGLIPGPTATRDAVPSNSTSPAMNPAAGSTAQQSLGAYESTTATTTTAASTSSSNTTNSNSNKEVKLEMSPSLAVQQQHSPYSNMSSPAGRTGSTPVAPGAATSSSPMMEGQHSPQSAGNTTLTPPPSITQHHRSQTSSMAVYRDKLGLSSPNQSPSMAAPPPTPPSTTMASPARRPSGGNKFRYSSGSAPAAATTSPFAMDGPSSREGTPSMQSGAGGDCVPNVDITRVKLEDKKQFSQVDLSPSGETASAKSPPSSMCPPPAPFAQEYEHYALQQQTAMQTHHQQSMTTSQQSLLPQQRHLGFGFDEPSNNNLLSSSHHHQQQNVTLQRHSLPHHAYYSHQLGHLYGSSAVQHHSDMMSIPSASSLTSQISGSSGGTRRTGTVKIGRRPSHLPKELKRVDKTLPSGWVRKLKQRKHGKQAGRWDVYIYSPCGVKFASKKKLKSFCEKNNLAYDVDDFDFTPYGRHTDSNRNHGNNSSTATSSSTSAVAASAAVASAAVASGTPGSGAAGRHNSSGSTGSEGTNQTGSSPASLHNYSPPSHYMAAAAAAAAGTSSGMMVATNTSGNSGYAGGGGADFGSFGFSDPRMENPPNASALDVPHADFGVSSSSGDRPVIPTALPYHPGRGHHHPLKQEPCGMTSSPAGAEFFASDLTVGLLDDSATSGGPNSAASANLINGYSSSFSSGTDKKPFPPPPPMVQIPLAGGTPGVREVMESVTDESAIKSENGKMTGLGTAFRALNSSQEFMEEYNIYN